MKNKKILFIFSNIFFFLTILFTYFDLRKYNIADSVYPYDFSFITYFIIILFLINLILLINETKDKLRVFIIFVYYLILSSGVYVLNFPLMDELILISSSFLFLCYLVKKKISLKRNHLIFFIILFILLIQSIVGIFSDFRSIRYILIFSSLLITFVYFSDLDEITENEYKIFLKYLFYSIILYVIYQFFFWYLKFFIFEMKFLEQRFIGDMQPSFSKSASGHMDGLLIFAGYFIILPPNSISSKKKLILFISIILYWIMADARSSLLLICIISVFYFFSLKINKKIFFIFLILLIFFQKDYFDNSLNERILRAEQEIVSVISLKTGSSVRAPTYKTDEGYYFYEPEARPVYGDFGRLKFVLGGLISYIYKPLETFVGCGFYNYYYCANEGLIYISEKFNVEFNISNKGFNNAPVRPPAAGTILVENGFFLIIIFILYYINFINQSLVERKKSQKIFTSFYFFIAIVSWSTFSNILDIIFFYLFFLPIFRKLLFAKI